MDIYLYALSSILQSIDYQKRIENLFTSPKLI